MAGGCSFVERLRGNQDLRPEGTDSQGDWSSVLPDLQFSHFSSEGLDPYMISHAIEQKESRIYEDELYRQPLHAAASYKLSPYKEQASTTHGQNSGNSAELQKGRCSTCAGWLSRGL